MLEDSGASVVFLMVSWKLRPETLVVVGGCGVFLRAGVVEAGLVSVLHTGLVLLVEVFGFDGVLLAGVLVTGVLLTGVFGVIVVVVALATVVELFSGEFLGGLKTADLFFLSTSYLGTMVVGTILFLLILLLGMTLKGGCEWVSP